MNPRRLRDFWSLTERWVWPLTVTWAELRFPQFSPHRRAREVPATKHTSSPDVSLGSVSLPLGDYGPISAVSPQFPLLDGSVLSSILLVLPAQGTLTYYSLPRFRHQRFAVLASSQTFPGLVSIHPFYLFGYISE